MKYVIRLAEGAAEVSINMTLHSGTFRLQKDILYLVQVNQVNLLYMPIMPVISQVLS